MKSRGLPQMAEGWLVNPWSAVPKERQERYFKSTRRPQSLMHSFCFSIQRALVWSHAWYQGYLTLLYRLKKDPRKHREKKIKRHLSSVKHGDEECELRSPPGSSPTSPLCSWTTLDMGLCAQGCRSPSKFALKQSAPQKWTAGSMGLNIRCFEACRALEQSSGNSDLGGQIQPATCLYTATG